MTLVRIASNTLVSQMSGSQELELRKKKRGPLDGFRLQLQSCKVSTECHHVGVFSNRETLNPLVLALFFLPAGRRGSLPGRSPNVTLNQDPRETRGFYQ